MKRQIVLDIEEYEILLGVIKNQDKTIKELEKNIPADGSVMLMTVTEKQYQSIKNLVGSKKALDKKITSENLLIF